MWHQVGIELEPHWWEVSVLAALRHPSALRNNVAPLINTKNSRCVFFYGDWGREFLVSVESQFSEFVTETKIGLKAQVVREIKGKIL